MRLIDADALKESIGPIGLLIAYRDPEVKRIKNVIDGQPTAYNVDSVVRQINMIMDDDGIRFADQVVRRAVSIVKGGYQGE